MESNNRQITPKLSGAEETRRQFDYIEKAKHYIRILESELGRKPTCCVTTFGCQMNARDSEKLTGILERVGYQVIEEENADFVIAYIHWGTELSETLHWAQPEQATKLAEAGADLIVGDHPHCLQEIAYIGDVPVVYSMGNFWFNSKTQDTGMLKVTIDQDGVKSLQFVPAIQSGCKTTIASENDHVRILNYIQSLSPTITIDNAGYITKR